MYYLLNKFYHPVLSQGVSSAYKKVGRIGGDWYVFRRCLKAVHNVSASYSGIEDSEDHTGQTYGVIQTHGTCPPVLFVFVLC